LQLSPSFPTVTGRQQNTLSGVSTNLMLFALLAILLAEISLSF
jgi:hypothetical protein